MFLVWKKLRENFQDNFFPLFYWENIWITVGSRWLTTGGGKRISKKFYEKLQVSCWSIFKLSIWGYSTNCVSIWISTDYRSSWGSFQALRTLYRTLNSDCAIFYFPISFTWIFRMSLNTTEKQKKSNFCPKFLFQLILCPIKQQETFYKPIVSLLKTNFYSNNATFVSLL